MGTYGDLQNRIADELARSDLTPQIQKAIQSSILFYQDDLFWFNDKETSINTVANTPSYALPSDFGAKGLITITVTGSRYPINQVSYEYIRERQIMSTLVGRPVVYAIFDQKIWTYPIPDAVYVLTVSYRAEFPVLIASGDSNAWTTEAETLIRCRSKWDLYNHVIKNQTQATLMAGTEYQEWTKLRQKTIYRVCTGRIKSSKF